MINKSLTAQESCAISYIRVLAMCSIVLCHFLQALDSNWAWVFNIGVQIFLLISGYLYGHKHIEGWISWFGKRFIRIYVPFALFFIAVIPVYAVSGKITAKQIIVYLLDLQGILGGVKGLGHLWFLTAIALCYSITPILQKTRRWARFLVWIVVAAAVIIFVKFPNYGYRSSWFILYALGYYLTLAPKIAKNMLVVLGVGIMTWLLLHFSWESMKDMHSGWSMVFHCTGAFLVVICFLFFYSLLKKCYKPKVIRVLDKYSFQIYIVHHILIMPPFGMLLLTEWVPLNMIIIAFYIVFYALILTVVSDKVVEKLVKK